MPRIDDTLDTLAGTKWFSTWALQNGYWQVEIADKKKTAYERRQFKVMPFGLCNAPAIFDYGTYAKGTAVEDLSGVPR